jgi:hypothetical protein
MMTMSKMFSLFLCLGCAVAQSSSDEEEQAQCDQCDNEGLAGEFTECDGCGDIVCDDCRECGEDCFVCRAARTDTETETETTESDGTATPDPPTAAAENAAAAAAENTAVPAIENTIPGSFWDPGPDGDVVRIFRRWLNLDDEVSDTEFCGEVIQALFCPFVAPLMGVDEFNLMANMLTKQFYCMAEPSLLRLLRPSHYGSASSPTLPVRAMPKCHARHIFLGVGQAAIV